MTITGTDKQTFFAEELRYYIEAVREMACISERRALFMSIVREFLGVAPWESDMESIISSGECSERLGNLVFVFKGNLHSTAKNLEPRLHKYIEDPHFRMPQGDYLAVVTDGLHFHFYLAQYAEDSQIPEFTISNGMNLASPLMTPERAAQDLGMILAQFRRAAAHPD